MIVLGIDPGSSGAMALYDTDIKNCVGIYDMPILMMTINRKQRKRLDLTSLSELVGMFKAMGVTLCVMEAVGGRPRQSASNGFTFGLAVGAVAGMIAMAKIPIETAQPQVWKKTMRVPGKGFSDDRKPNEAIVAKADELMPDSRLMWRGVNGGLKVDRAEAALIAKYGADILLRVALEKPFNKDGQLHYRDVEINL